MRLSPHIIRWTMQEVASFKAREIQTVFFLDGQWPTCTSLRFAHIKISSQWETFKRPRLKRQFRGIFPILFRGSTGEGGPRPLPNPQKKEEEEEAGKNRVDQTVKMWEKSTLRACSHVCPSIARRSVSDRPSPPPSWTNFFPRGRIVFLLSCSYAHVTQ